MKHPSHVVSCFSGSRAADLATAPSLWTPNQNEILHCNSVFVP
jgi:hypothetical protein